MNTRAAVIHEAQCDVCKERVELSRQIFNGGLRIELPVVDAAGSRAVVDVCGFTVCFTCFGLRYDEKYHELYEQVHKDAWGWRPDGR